MVEFSYKLADKWADKVAGCKRGHNQSPISLSSNRATYDGELANLSIVGKPGTIDWTVRNNGHTVEVSTEDSEFYFNLNNDSVKKYKIVSYHFHWNKKRQPGSEHTINNKRFDVELHFVCLNTVYKDLNEAIQHEDGLTYLAVMMVESKPDKNSLFKQLVNLNMSDIYPLNSQTFMRPINLAEIITKRVPCEKYYRYFGSMTTPPCAEVVTWIVLAEPVKISSNDLAELKSVVLAYEDDKCFRPLQLPYQRVPLKNFKGSNGCC